MVLDVCNIAVVHGNGVKFSVEGVLLAMRHFEDMGLKTIGILPNHFLLDVASRAAHRAQKGLTELDPKLVPDDVEALQKLKDEKRLFTSPSGDYDDSYIIQYARQCDGYICSNDKYIDHIESHKQISADWLKSHRVSFSFILETFIPNPDFNFSKHPNSKKKRKSNK
eukprot:c19937_g1_i5.p1 GENE.c19937_g1_i5~~c19937_g1_i5.p1  ORF type:complete len:167 (+),score=38.85 c19937_g1_i5:526-1026(+)